MGFYVVLRTIFDKYPSRPLKEIVKLERISNSGWSWWAKDLDHQQSADGFVDVYKKERAAKRIFENSKGIDGETGSVYLIYAKTLTKKGAAKMALGNILLEAYNKGEILDAHHPKGEASVDKA